MARIKLVSYLKSMSGGMGDVVFYNSRGREYVRAYVKPANPDTEGQRAVRRTFGDAVRSWRELPPCDKEAYRRRARMLPMSGYNLFISRYMKRNVPASPARTSPGTPFVRNGFGSNGTFPLSVSPPFHLYNGVVPVPEPPAAGPGMG